MIDATVDNILSVFFRATPEQLQAGMNWYRHAHACAEQLDPINPSRAAGVIAALSPRVNWDRNLLLAARTFRNGEASGAIGTSVRKANEILNGAHPLLVLKGAKTRNFYLNIADPASDAGVTIDRHAFDIAVGYPTDDDTRAMLGKVGVYDAFADLYRYAAREVGVAAPILQAITWTTWREEKGIMR